MNNNINPALEKYTELIIKKIKEVDASEWQKPWFTPTFIGVPQNLSGRPYSNLNKVLLYAVCDENKYSTPVFITFHQAQENKNTERSTCISYHLLRSVYYRNYQR